MNWQANYKAIWRGANQYVGTLSEGDGKLPHVAQAIGHNCSFIVGVEAVASGQADKHLDEHYIPPSLWHSLLREWRRDEQMLRGLDDAVGGE